MPLSPRPLVAALAFLISACGHARATKLPAAGPTTATRSSTAQRSLDHAEPASERRGAAQPTAQHLSFDDDADPQPTTEVRGAPKRPPLPRFRLFGTREGDGP